MKVVLDGAACELKHGESLLDAVKKLGLGDYSLRLRPLAAMIGGEVFSLRYTPFRDAQVHLLRYGEDMGRRVYERTLQFIFIVAVRKLFPGARVLVRYSLGPGLYISVDKEPALAPQDVLRLEGEMRNLVRAALPLERKRLDIKDAIAFYEKDGQFDKAKLLRWRNFNYFDVYTAEGHMDYFYGEMAPSTDYCDVFRQSDEWGGVMKCSTVNELNTMVKNGSIRELVRVNEALHEKSYAAAADGIVAKRARAVLVAGPSSSGKTTSAHRIATQLRVLAQEPIMLSLDNYYLDRDQIPSDEKGEKDLENINTLDIPRFNADLAAILRGEEVETPLFDFLTGKRAPGARIVRAREGQPVIIEGIHGLNPQLTAGGIDENKLFRVYVSALTTLNLDDHNRIRTTDVRLLRRLVRDYNTRGASMERTFSMWPSVRKGEETWIFPYQENADMFLNTTLVYEIAVLRKYVFPLLQQVPAESPSYAAARDIVKFLNYFLDADIEDEIPPTSILREFIGGNTFYREG